MVRAEQTDGRQPMTWSGVDWTATEAVVGRIQDRIFRAAKIKRPRLEPDDEQSSCPVLRGLGSGNGARLPDAAFGKTWIGPMPARLRPGRGGSEQPRRAHGVYDVGPGEWIGVPVPPLVEEALFEAAREQLAENRRRNRQHARGQRYLLQGLVVCRQCGYAYYGKAISLRSAKGKRRAYAYY